MYTAQIRKSKLDAILRRHPWIFSGAIETDTSSFEDGALIDAVRKDGSFLARGHFQPGSIAIRILSFDENEKNDQNFWK
jgi:Predicted SAM-dependent methyltransferases